MSGAEAENQGAAYLAAAGWTILGRNVRFGRDEIDVVALDPGPPPAIVAVEVRSLRDPRFGTPEERVDREKVARLYRGLAALRAAGTIDAPAAASWRVDLVLVDRRSSPTVIRHLRSIEPP